MIHVNSFDVNPKSGRWDVTETGTTDDLIVDGNLRTITTENTTGETSEYFMQRGLQSSDDKIDYRYKALTDNSSQVEYFRDVLGDSNDCEESDLEGSWIADVSSTTANGICTFISSADNEGLRWTDTTTLLFNYLTFNSIEFRLKSDIDSSNEFRFFYDDSNTQAAIAFTSNSTWTTFSFDKSDMVETGSPVGKASRLDLHTVTAQSTYPVEFSLDYIKIFFDLDYATHAEGEVEDTWDWEDSLEYGFDTLDNVTDFNDGSIENFTAGSQDDTSPTFINNGNEYLDVTVQAGGDIVGIQKSSLSIAASGATGYDYFTMEFNSIDQDIEIIEIMDSADNVVCTDSSYWTANTWYLFTCDLDLSPSWTGTETEYDISFKNTSTVFVSTDIVRINMVYLYDTALGDIEGFSANSPSPPYLYVDPVGYLIYGFSSFSNSASRTIARSVDTSIFDTVVVRAKSNEANTKLQIRSRDFLTTFTSFTLTTSFQVFSYDLSLSVDWTGNIDMIGLVMVDDSGNLEGTERLIVDYVLLEASEGQSQDFTLGFWDQDNSQALVNVTHHFYNGSMFRWEIELYDSNQEIASYYYSANQTVTNIYYRAEISYNTLESEFEIKISQDDGTRIFKADWTTDFTNSGNIPAFFAFAKSPVLYLSTYTVFYGHQEIWMDFILASYKMNEWKNTLEPTWTNITNHPLNYRTEEGCSSEFCESTWQLHVPYLDSVSGNLFTQVYHTGVGWLNADEHTDISFRIYSVNALTGALTQRVRITIFMDDTNLPKTRIIYPSDQFESDTLYSNISIGFNVDISEDRTKLTTQTVIDLDSFNNAPESIVDSREISIAGESNEFVLETSYDPFFTGDGVFVAGLDSFGFVSKDIFADIGNFLGGGVDFVGDILEGLGNLIVSIFTALLLPLFLFIADIMKVVTDQLGALLETAIDAIAPLIVVALAALEPFLDGLEGLLGDLATAIGAIAVAIWSALEPVITDLLDVFLGLLLDVVNGIMDVGQAAWLIFWDGIFDIIDNTGGLKAQVTGFWPNVSTAVSDSLGLLNILASLSIFILIGLVFFIFSLPFLQSNGDVFKGTSGVFNNAFRGVKTPHVGIFGNQIALVIPLILIVYVALKLAIAAGTIPDIFGGLPI